jgi:hypothetical protein
MGQMKNEYRILVGNTDGKRPRRRPRHRWDGNIIMVLKNILFIYNDRILFCGRMHEIR